MTGEGAGMAIIHGKHVTIAIVCDWLVTYAGAERVLEQMLVAYPDADVYAVIDFLPEAERGFLHGKPVHTTFIQNLPFAATKYRLYLPLMPLAIEQLDLSSYDIVISSSHAVAKGVLVGPDQLHISYVHSPLRYAWDMQGAYLRESHFSALKAWLARILLHYLRIWDARTANSVDAFVANSRFIARRILKCYRREAVVIYPPVDVAAFALCDDKSDYYLTASRLVVYKNVQLIVEAFRQMSDKRLVVIGDGPEYGRLREMAGENVTFFGYCDRATMIEKMQHARAFLFAAEEDFGITPVEAQACGTPVIAYRKGGVTESVEDICTEEDGTGLFFDEQTAESVKDTVERFERLEHPISPTNCRKRAERFSEAAFRAQFKQYVEKKYIEFHNRNQ